jgi:acyl-CoA synthetase (AMP-forming)/AMP-acid ligase II
MNALDRLRQARSVDQLADEIEPLAQSLAILADDARAALSETLSQAQAQAETWSRHQTETAAQWQQTARAVEQAAQRLENATERARWLVQGRNWRSWVAMLLGAIIASAIAPSVSALWQRPSQDTITDAENWRRFVQKYQQLPPDKQQLIDRMIGWNKH